MQIKIINEFFDEIDQKILLITMVGIFDSIQNGAITIDEAERFLFSPYMARKLRSKKCPEKIIEIVDEGCELEDIESLLPDILNDEIDKMKERTLNHIKNYEEFNQSFWLVE